MSIQAIIDGKFLSLCPPSEAVAWLKGKREATRDVRFAQENKHEEETLAARNDPYVDFGLARYGWCAEACGEVYERGDHAIRCTFLAHFPNGGFHKIFADRFILADQTHPGRLALGLARWAQRLVARLAVTAYDHRSAWLG